MEISKSIKYPEKAYKDIELIASKLVEYLFEQKTFYQSMEECRASYYSYGTCEGYYGSYQLDINGNVFASLNTKTGAIHVREPGEVTPLHVEVYKLLAVGREIVNLPMSYSVVH